VTRRYFFGDHYRGEWIVSFNLWSRLRRFRHSLLEGAFLFAFMAAATLIAYEIDIFPNSPGRMRYGASLSDANRQVGIYVG
jgi:hypothetical protein